VEGILGEGVTGLVFGLVGLFGCGEKGEISGLAFFIQGKMGLSREKATRKRA
jgi:hypothetical protein